MKILYRSLGLVAVLALSTLLHSCDKVKDAISINVPTQTVTADFYIVPIQTVGTQQAAATFEYGINLDSLIKKESSDLGIGNIKSAKVTSVVLTLNKSTATDNFGSFQAAEIGLSSNAIQDYKVVAGVSSIADQTQTTLDIPVNNVELKDYFNSSVFRFKLSAIARRATTTQLEGKATIKFNVTAGL